MIAFADIVTACNRTRTSEGLRVALPYKSWRSDMNGTPLDISELDAVVIHGTYNALCNCWAELKAAHGIHATWNRDNIGAYLTLPIERVSFPAPYSAE